MEPAWLVLLLVAFSVSSSFASENTVLNSTRGYVERRTAVARMSETLSSASVRGMIDFVKNPGPQRAVSGEELDTLRNDVLDKLLGQRLLPPGLSRIVLGIVENQNEEAVWRDYVLQKVPQLVARQASDPEFQKEMVGAVKKLAAEKKHSFSGTALIALERMSRGEIGHVGREEVARIAIGVASSATHSAINRQTALQVAGACNAPGSAVLARMWLGDTSQPVNMRAAAAAVLGQTGGSGDLEQLTVLGRSGDTRLRTAALRAIEGLRE